MIQAIEEVILSVKDVNLSYGKKQILSNINFEIKNVKRQGYEQGQIVSLIGRSGIGKSQLFRILSGFSKFQTTNKMSVTGEVLTGLDQSPVRLGDMGVVTQNYKLYEHRTVKRNLMFSGADMDIINEYTQAFDLFQHLDKYPKELSGGQRQRVAILQQVLVGSDFILLDEPFSGLDDIMLRKTIDLLVKVSLLHELKTLIIISHDIESSLAISDTAFLMTKPSTETGAVITDDNKYDLRLMDLAWKENIKEDRDFRNLLNLIKSKL